MFRDIEQYPGSEEMSGYVILQLGSPIFFANSTYVRERILRWIRDEPEDVEFLLLDLSGDPIYFFHINKHISLFVTKYIFLIHF